MNFYLVFILITIIGMYLLDMVVTYLDIRSLRPELPGEFEGFYDRKEYQRSQEYSRVRARFSHLTASGGFILTLSVILLGGFNMLDTIVRSLGFNQVLTGLIYIGLLGFIADILSTPFELYNTFVIEEKFGFNKTTYKTWILDKVKGYCLGLVIGGVLLTLILYFFQAAGRHAWLYCWLGTTIFMLILQFIAPTLIMPLFNKFTPLEDGELKSSIAEYAAKVDFSLSGIFVIDGSRRSAKSNAFFTGFGSKKRIALFDTLIAKHTTQEIVSILAHEIGHYKNKHIIRMMAAGIIKTGFIFFLMSFFMTSRGLFDAFLMENMSVYGGLIFFMILYSPISFLFSIGANHVSRNYEYEADRFAVETTVKPDDMIAALKKLSVHNLSNLTPHKLDVFLNYSHPPVLQRIAAIRTWGAAPNPGKG